MVFSLSSSWWRHGLWTSYLIELFVLFCWFISFIIKFLIVNKLTEIGTMTRLFSSLNILHDWQQCDYNEWLVFTFSLINHPSEANSNNSFSTNSISLFHLLYIYLHFVYWDHFEIFVQYFLRVYFWIILLYIIMNNITGISSKSLIKISIELNLDKNFYYHGYTMLLIHNSISD